MFFSLAQMSSNGSDQLEKAMEEVLDDDVDDDDDEEEKLEKSCVEKMEKQGDVEDRVPETHREGIDAEIIGSVCSRCS